MGRVKKEGIWWIKTNDSVQKLFEHPNIFARKGHCVVAVAKNGEMYLWKGKDYFFYLSALQGKMLRKLLNKMIKVERVKKQHETKT